MRQLAEEGRAAREAAAARKTTADIPAGGYGAEGNVEEMLEGLRKARALMEASPIIWAHSGNVVMNSTDCEHGVPPDERCVICDAGQP